MPTLLNSQIHNLPQTHIQVCEVYVWTTCVCAYNVWIICKCWRTLCLFPDTGPKRWRLVGRREGGKGGRKRGEGPKALASQPPVVPTGPRGLGLEREASAHRPSFFSQNCSQEEHAGSRSQRNQMATIVDPPGSSGRYFKPNSTSHCPVALGKSHKFSKLGFLICPAARLNHPKWDHLQSEREHHL